MAAAFMFVAMPASGELLRVYNALDGNIDPDAPEDSRSLRGALIRANSPSNPGLDVIVLCASGPFVLNQGTNEDAARAGDLDVLEDVRIRAPLASDGCGSGTVFTPRTIDGGTHGRIFDVIEGSLELTGVVLTRGRSFNRDSASCDRGGGAAVCVRAAQNGEARKLTMTGSTITDSVGSHGGAIFVDVGSEATLTNVTIEKCTATTQGNATGFGGGLALNGATATVVRSTIKSNTALAGGGISARVDPVSGAPSTLTLTRSGLASNKATATGGGIGGGGLYVAGISEATVENSTFSANQAADGGAIRVLNRTATGGGKLTLEFVTVTGSPTGNGISINRSQSAPRPVLLATLLADNKPHDCAGEIVSQGFNLVEDTTGCGSVCETSAADVWCKGTPDPENPDGPGIGADRVSTPEKAVDAKLAALATNGTHPIPIDSPALNAVPSSQCTVTEDHAGTARSNPDDKDGKGLLQCACDIGSYEFPLPDGDKDGVVDCDDDCAARSNPPPSTPPGLECSTTADCVLNPDVVAGGGAPDPALDQICGPRCVRKCFFEGTCTFGGSRAPCEDRKCADEKEQCYVPPQTLASAFPNDPNGVPLLMKCACPTGKRCTSTNKRGVFCDGNEDCAGGDECLPEKSTCVAEKCRRNEECNRRPLAQDFPAALPTGEGTGSCLLTQKKCTYPQSGRSGNGDADVDNVPDCQEPLPCLEPNGTGLDDPLGIDANGCSLEQACACDGRSEICECPGEDGDDEPGDRSETWVNPREYRRCFKHTAGVFNRNNTTCGQGICANFKGNCTNCQLECPNPPVAGVACKVCHEDCNDCPPACQSCPDDCPTLLSGRELKQLTRSILKGQRQSGAKCGRRDRCRKNETLSAVGDCDHDGVLDLQDNCPRDFNRLQSDGTQRDTDSDGDGDVCDADDDGDGIPDADDNCRKDANEDQLDGDDDNIGTECDACKRTPSGENANIRGCSPGQKPDRELD